jgi:hypothetical protein
MILIWLLQPNYTGIIHVVLRMQDITAMEAFAGIGMVLYCMK